jgi:hypothetical protein
MCVEARQGGFANSGISREPFIQQSTRQIDPRSQHQYCILLRIDLVRILRVTYVDMYITGEHRDLQADGRWGHFKPQKTAVQRVGSIERSQGNHWHVANACATIGGLSGPIVISKVYI